MSSEKNIIKVYFKGTHLTHSKTQYQYNHGMILHFADLNLPQAFETHFANKQHGNSKTVIGSENKVEIPDEYFWTGANEIYAWVYLHSDVDDGETVYEVRIPLTKRAKPSDEEPLPEQQSAIDRAIAELSHAVETTNADAEQTSADREAVTALRDEVIDLRDEAEQSAQTATAKANEANESASSASESEQNAHDYADDAKRYAENAFSSKETAVASASDAEQAKEDAEQARDDAQGAKSDAIQIKQDVVGLKDDVVNLKDDVIVLKEQTDTNVTHYPKVIDEYWHVWNASLGEYVNTNVKAKGEKGDRGDTYVLTEEDKEDIAGLVDIPIQIKYVKDDESDNGGVIEGSVSGNYANVASGNGSHAEGQGTLASGHYSHAEGAGNISSGSCSHVEGNHNKASGNYSHAEGSYSVASGNTSHAEGYSTASGSCSHAEGYSVEATGSYSHAEGYNTIAGSKYQHVEGKYNIEDSNNTYAHIVGGGTSDINHKNIYTLDWQGNGVYSGKVTVGSAPTNDMDVATKKYVDDVKGASIHICSSEEYNSTTRLPTIQNPDERTFYLVPSEDGTSPDLFIEWAYVNNAWEMFGSASIDLSGYLTDVTVGGNSVVTDGVANVPIADSSTLGVIRTSSGYGLNVNASGIAYVSGASDGNIKTGTDTYRPIVSNNQHASVFYGLAKASGDTTQSASSNAVGTYTDEAKASIQTMLGVPSTDDVVSDVQIDGTSIVQNGVANIPVGNFNQLGAVKTDSAFGINANSAGRIYTCKASETTIKTGTHQYMPIVPYNQDIAAFYGLSKAAGDTTQSQSSNAVGTYTDEAKIAIQKMLGIYQAPWELIREDTFTNAEEADHIISTDANGESFELTDVVLELIVPTHNEDTVIADYHRVYFSEQNVVVATAYLGNNPTRTITANSAIYMAIASVTQDNGLMCIGINQWASRTSRNNKQILIEEGLGSSAPYRIKNASIDSIKIGKITGSMKYRIYGRRKWQ